MTHVGTAFILPGLPFIASPDFDFGVIKDHIGRSRS
jgi:hypothetical protein